MCGGGVFFLLLLLLVAFLENCFFVLSMRRYTFYSFKTTSYFASTEPNIHYTLWMFTTREISQATPYFCAVPVLVYIFEPTKLPSNKTVVVIQCRSLLLIFITNILFAWNFSYLRWILLYRIRILQNNKLWIYSG